MGSFLESVAEASGGIVALLYRVAALTGFAAGVALLVSAAVAPDLPVRVLLAVEPKEVAELLRIDRRTVVALYGGGLAAVSAAGYLFLAGVENVLRGAEAGGRLTVRFLVVASFAASFVIARLLVTLSGIMEQGARTGSIIGIPVGELWVWGYHLHHYFAGFLLLAAVGWMWLFREHDHRRLGAVMYGAGLGVFLDEVGMLLTEGDYFALSTYVVVVAFLSVLLAGLYWDLYKME